MPRPLLLLLLPGVALAVPESTPAQNGLTRTLVAREPMFKNPVAVSVDVDGSIYVTETERRKVADLDIREVTWWIADDLSHTSVAEKAAFFRKSVTPERFKNHPSLKDFNKDSTIDSKDLTLATEKIHKLVDTDGDGAADKSMVFAEGFNTEVTGIAAGVLAWRGDVYSTIAPDLWKLRDTNGDGKADARKSLVTGFGVHINYAGHDMHGLLWGPDGKIYWTIGDKGTNVTSGGLKWLYPHEGALLRCKPDGSEFEVVARGLRNVQQVAFDDHGNLFGVDNDSDAPGEKERFIYITEGSDTGWRSYYQYRGGKYNPWMAERIAFPDGPDQPACVTPALSTYVDGPSGFAYNPGTALGERYRGYFFMTQFPAGKISAFKAEQSGASFKMTDDQLVDKGTPFVGCNFGPDGALYVADWQGGYPLKEKGALWKIDDAKESVSPLRKEVATFLREGPSKVTDADLTKRLGHADQRVRLDAQWELARREKWDILQSAAASGSAPPLARIHGLWGLSQGKRFSDSLFAALAIDTDAEIRAQAAKWAGECGKRAELASLLADESLRVRFHAAMAVGKTRDTRHLPAVVKMLAENANQDAYLRHAGAFALRRALDPAFLSALVKDPSPAVRLAAVVAIRDASQDSIRITPAKSPVPEILKTALATALADSDPAVVAEAARAVYEDPFTTDEFPALASLIESKPDARESAIRRSIAANRRTGDDASLLRLARFAASKAPAKIRQAALEALASIQPTDPLDPVDGRYAPLNPVLVSTAISSQISTLLAPLEKEPELSKPATAALDALGAKQDPEILVRQALDAKADPSLRLGAIQHLKDSNEPKWIESAVAMLKQDIPGLRPGVAALLATAKPDFALSYVRNIGLKSSAVAERQAAVRLLGTLSASEALTGLLSDLSAGKLDPSIQLEVLETANELHLDEVHSVEAALEAKSPVGKWTYALAGGNPVAGKKIFEESLSANCTACHRIGAEGSAVGPPLTDIGKKDRAYILESLVIPSAQLAPGFGPVTTMPPMGLILAPGELRDLVEYLTTLK